MQYPVGQASLKYIKSHLQNTFQNSKLGMSAPLRSCLFDAFANVWVDLFHAVCVSKQALAKEQQQIRLSLVQRELLSCQQQLQKKEADLQVKIETLGREAVAKKKACKDIAGAKKRMLERKRLQSQLEKLQNTMMTIDMQKNTIEGSALDRTVLETLKASADALRQIGASTSGVRAVEDIVSDVEQQMESAAEITKILSAGSVTGIINTMAVDGIAVDEDELLKELDELVGQENAEDKEEQGYASRLLDLPRPASSSSSSTLTRIQREEAGLSSAAGVRSILQMQVNDF